MNSAMTIACKLEATRFASLHVSQAAVTGVVSIAIISGFA
jgi:hypothetical protein